MAPEDGDEIIRCFMALSLDLEAFSAKPGFDLKKDLD